MKTISAQEFSKQYGTDSFDKFNVPGQEQTPGYFQRVGQNIKTTAKNLGSDLETQAETFSAQDYNPDSLDAIKNRVRALARGGLRTVGATINTGFAPIMEAPGIKQVTEAIGNKIADTTLMQKFKELAQKHPEAAKDIGNIVDIASLFGGEAVAKPVTEAVAGATNAATKTIDTALEGAIQTTTRVAEKTAGRLPKLLGIFSGENDDVIRKALQNPKVADIGIEQGDEALRKAVQEGANESVKIKNTFIKAYAQAKNTVLGGYEKVVIPKNNVKGIFNDLLRKNGVYVGPEGLDFGASNIVANPGEVGKIKAAWEGLDKWNKFTLGSLDDYKQFVGKLRTFANESGKPSKSPFLGELYHELDGLITENPIVPERIRTEYAELNKNFSNQIDLYDEIVKAFNSGDPFSRLANALGKNKDTLRKTLEFYEKKSGKRVMPLVAGRELAMEKTAAFGFLNPRSWIDLLVPPEVQAKVITGVAKKFPKITEKALRK